MKITSNTNSLIKKYYSLKDKKNRDLFNMFLIEGIDNIIEAYRSNIVSDILFYDELPSLLKNLDVNYQEVSENIIEKLSFNKSYQNYIAIGKISHKDFILSNCILAFDGVQDPGNGGSLIRSAKAFNFNTVLVSNDSVDIYNDKFIKASKGYNFSINLKRCSLKEELLNLKKLGYVLVGADAHETSSSLNDFLIDEKIVLVVGNEGQGLSQEIKEILDKYVYIEMNSDVESLNVAIAGSIIMHKIFVKK